MRAHACPHCDSRELFESRSTAAKGSHGPDLLPGLAPWYRGAKMTVVVCRSCGLTRFFASEEARQKLGETEKWTRLS